jgi:hypothetical protein
MSAWLWLLLAAIVILPVALRFCAEEPDNAIRQEQPGDDGEEREPDLGELTAAA